MKERIKELYGEAVEYTSSQDDGTKNQLQMNHVCADKFAELIVLECMELSDKALQDGKWPGDVLEDHFGVER